jgi:exosortase/archaeosortase family protein
VFRFLVVWLVLDVLVAWARPVHEALDCGLAQLLSRGLGLTGVASRVVGEAVYFRGFCLRVKEPCNGLELVVILVAWILASTATWGQRARAMAWMLPALACLNLIRLYSLGALLLWAPRFAEPAHLYAWQVVMMGIVLAMSIGWGVHAAAVTPRLGRS